VKVLEGLFGDDDELVSILDQPHTPARASDLGRVLIPSDSLDWVVRGKATLIGSLRVSGLLHPEHGLSRVEDGLVEQGYLVCFHSLRRWA